MSSRIVSHDKSVLAPLVFEEVKNPCLFHQSGNKIEVRFVVLHHDVTRLIGALECTSKVTKSKLLKNLR